MRRSGLRFLLIGSVLAAAIASADHLFVPAWIDANSSYLHLNRQDITRARAENARGKPITVSQDEIVER